MNVAKLARPEIQQLHAYRAAAQVDDTIRLNANEAAWTSERDQHRRPLNRYPELRPVRLQHELAIRYGCAAEQLLVTRGTSEGIDLLIRSFCRAGEDNVLTTEPGFSMYAHYAAIQGAGVRTLVTDRDAGFQVDIDALLAAANAKTRVIFVCSPNNPTGSSIPRSDLEQLLRQRGDQSVVVVDEAYIEFSTESSAVELLAEHGNLVVLRTLSKALAFAGARCGAVIGPSSVIELLAAVQAPYAMATPVVECVENALQSDRLDEAARKIAVVVSERERLTGALSQHPLVQRIWPSAANFFLLQLTDVPLLLRQCEADGILLRYFGGTLDDCVRVTVGTAAENDRLLASFAKLGDF